MQNIILGYVLSFGYVAALIGFVGLLKKIFKFELEVSRKLIHTFLAFTWVILYHYLRGTWHFVIMPFIVIFVNALSYKFKIFKMFERDDSDGKNHFGTIYFAIVMTIMAALTQFFPELMIPYGVAVFCLSFGDGAAALFGSMVKSKIMIRKDKSLVGTICCAVFAVVGIYILNLFIPLDLPFWGVVVLGIATAAAELVGAGLDNFSIPAATMLITWLLMNYC